MQSKVLKIEFEKKPSFIFDFFKAIIYNFNSIFCTANMKVRFLVPWLLSAMLMESTVFQILIHPTGATSEPADYMYDLDEDGIGDETGIDFGSPFEPLTFTSYKSHNHDEDPPGLKTNKSISSGTLTFDIETDEREKGQTNVETDNQGSIIINISIKSNENDDRFQSKLSWTGDRFFGCLLVTFCKLIYFQEINPLCVFLFHPLLLLPFQSKIDKKTPLSQHINPFVIHKSW